MKQKKKHIEELPATATGTSDELAFTAEPHKSRTLLGDTVRRLRKNKLALAGLAWVTLVVTLTLTAQFWAPGTLGDPVKFNTAQTATERLQPPSWEHPFGTDNFGRDVASRTVYGAKVSLRVGLLAVGISITLGLIFGALAAFYGGFWDTLIMRLADVFLAFPYILFAIAMLAILGPSETNLFVAIGILGWPSIARVFRSSILSVKEHEYVDAARALGASDARIITRHILPNAIAPIVVYGTMSIGGAILSEAALSFLGMGVQLPNPSWGNMLSEARTMLVPAPWMMLWPGFAILTTVLAFVLMGDGLRDALDVKMKD